jgi:putative effector of murein hydrolase LrgA (UPF0299 family)
MEQNRRRRLAAIFVPAFVGLIGLFSLINQESGGTPDS